MQFFQGKKMDNDMWQGHVYFFSDQIFDASILLNIELIVPNCKTPHEGQRLIT